MGAPHYFGKLLQQCVTGLVTRGIGGRLLVKSPRRFSKASCSTKRRVEKVIRRGERGVKRALSASRRRELVERLENER